jgi:hypothetical protein
VLPACPARPTEVSARSDVSELGIPLPLSGPSPVLVNSATTVELINNKVYRIGASAIARAKNNATTEADAIEKNITPLGGFPHYGVVNHDFVMVKGGIVGTRKRPIILRKSNFPQTKNAATEKIEVKFIDTSSKIGHGKFQTLEEKDKFLGPLASKQPKAA